MPWACPDLVLTWAFTLPWPCLDLNLTMPWPCLDLSLTLPRAWIDFALTLPLKFSPNLVSNSWDIPNMYKCHQKNVAWTNVAMTVGICSRCSQEPIFKVSSKSGKLELRYSWYGQMLPGQMLPGQISPWQLESVLDVHRNLPLKFHQNRVSNSWDIAYIEFLWWWGLQSNFIVKPNIVLGLGWGFDNSWYHQIDHSTNIIRKGVFCIYCMRTKC